MHAHILAAAHHAAAHHAATAVASASASPAWTPKAAGEIAASATDGSALVTMLGIMVVFMLMIVLYWVPSMVATKRKHVNENAIIMLNFMLGWTFLGWVIALVWAFTGNVKPRP